MDFPHAAATVVALIAALLPLWGIVARAAVRARPGRVRGLLAVAATVPLLREIVARAAEGAEVASAIACVSLVWLVWGLLRAASDATLVE